jgi:hypothetical protein
MAALERGVAMTRSHPARRAPLKGLCQDPGSEISRALARLQIPRPAAAFSRKISPERM